MSLKIFTPILGVLLSYSLVLFSSVSESLVKEEFIFKDPSFNYCDASSIVETPSGDLLCAFIAGDCEDSAHISIWTTRLAKGSSKWTEPTVVARHSEVPCWNPVLVVTSTEETLLFYKVGKNTKEWTAYLKRSKDSGNKWSNIEILPAGVYGPIKNKPLQLSKETLLCGSSTESFKKWDCWMDITTDNGKTWFKSEPIVSGSLEWGISQPTLFYAKDGQIKMLARSKDRKVIMQSTSKDDGISWSNAAVTTLPNPNAGIDCVNLSPDQVLLVYNHSTAHCYPLNISTSSDDGVTWEMKGALEKGKGYYAYPSVIKTKDGQVHITYTWNRSLIKHVVIDPSKL